MATLVERRRFMQALAAASAVPAAAAPQAAASDPSPEEATPVTTVLHDLGGPTTPSYFSERDLATLTRLSDLLMPPMDGKPGALDAEVPQFLDFYVAQSPQERRDVYRAGLETLHNRALTQFGKTFAKLSDSEADKLIAPPLAVPWTLSAPADPLAAFLREAKKDVMNATKNAYVYVTTQGRTRSRQRSSSLYWYTIE
ncbi:MAG: gluconate 2-dehydrogenase subunit 3 family protein [Bryobacterales bacterium]|nr:gluconate 2-dehydrogenase subunit 3 family protein [Acidobacteriota bacterium]MCB9385718.1 gluconate 2-dehydrogenase subunit 3 family protein [Bryobacterales bacterium]